MSDRELRLVTWVDAAHTEGWVDPDEAEFADFGVSVCRCVGFVIRENDDEILLAQSVDDRHGRIDAVMAIPKVAITGSVTVHEARKHGGAARPRIQVNARPSS